MALSVYRLEYTYGIGGQLKSVENPFGEMISYAHDKLGRLSTVTGSSFAGITSYASSPHYRAWGALQSLSFSNSTVMSMTFDNRLRANHSQLVKNGTTTVMSKDYGFYSDGSLRKLDDLVDNKFDRVQTYDNMGRPKTAKSGMVARGDTPSGSGEWQTVPYNQSFGFNAFGNATGRDHKHWGLQDYDFDYSYTNNRLTTGMNNLYDADGRQTRVQELSDILNTTYDAAGRPTFFHRAIAPMDESEITRHFDGDGREVKREKRNYTEEEPKEWEWVNEPTEYYIRSSVLGGETITRLSGGTRRTIVYAGGAELAWQNKSGSTEEVLFQNWDASGMSYLTLNQSGTPYSSFGSEGSPAELDGMGGNAGAENPYIIKVMPEPCVGCESLQWETPLYVNGQPLRANLNGIDVPLSVAFSFMASGAANVLHTRANQQILGQLGIAGYWEDFLVGEGSRPNPDRNPNPDPDEDDSRIFYSIIETRFIAFVGGSWIPLPQNKKNPNQGNCDYRLSRIFGDMDAYFATVRDPPARTIEGGRTGMRDREQYRGLEHPADGHAHLYPNWDGLGVNEINAYAPPGFDERLTEGEPYTAEGGERQNFVRLYYQPETLSRYGYDGGLIINFTHIGPTNSKGKPLNLPSRRRRNPRGSVGIGILGNAGGVPVGGGQKGFHTHSHMIFSAWNGGKTRPNKEQLFAGRIDVRKVFCKDLGF